jgi:cephalosporin-C deacetylase-like acetyl esterase
MTTRSLRLATLVVFSAAALAQTVDSQQEFWNFLETRARAITARAFEETQSAPAFDRVRSRRLEELRDMLGLLPWPERTPLRPVITGTLDQGDYTVEKLAFESMPKVYVSADLYVPKRRTGKLPAVVYVCGHSNSPQGAKTVYQRHGISFAKNGYVALMVDPIQIAETFGLHHGVHSQEMFDWYSRGYTPGGVEAWNAIRAVDYLLTRPEVDPDRIGITGRSGGAATSWYAGALDSRLKVVAPIMGLGTYEQHVHNKTHALHCDCMFPINIYGQDGIHQAALIAPRPLLMGHGSKDVLFPGYLEVERGLKTLYASYGHPDRFESVVVDTGHADSDFLREKVVRWFDRHLRNTPDRDLDMAYTNEEPERLAVFGGKPPADAQNFRLHEFFVPMAMRVEPTTLPAWERRRAAILNDLHAKVFPQLTGPVAVTATTVPTAPDVPAGYENLRLTAAGRAPVRALIRRPKKAAEPAPAVVLVAAEGDTPKLLNALLATTNTRDTAVRMIVLPPGISEWDRDFYKGATRQAMQVGETVDSIRLAGVLMAVEALRHEASADPAKILVAGRGNSGALALYSAILDPRIAQVMMLDAPESHLSGPVFLNILRYTDLPEAAALIAPRHLTFYNRMPSAYSYTKRIYKLVGQPVGIGVAMQIEGVVEGRYDHGFGSGQ